jgi:hypothetical protein
MDNTTTTPNTKPAAKYRVEFLTSDYEFAHGHGPRGRGAWAFSSERNPDVTGPTMFWAYGPYTYGEAKKLARAHFAARGVSSVWVLS